MFSILYPYSKITIFGSHLRHILSELVSPISRIFLQEAGLIALFFTCPGLQFKPHNCFATVSLPVLPHARTPVFTSAVAPMLLLQFFFQTEYYLAPDPARHLTPVYSHAFEHRLRLGVAQPHCLAAPSLESPDPGPGESVPVQPMGPSDPGEAGQGDWIGGCLASGAGRGLDLNGNTAVGMLRADKLACFPRKNCQAPVGRQCDWT